MSINRTYTFTGQMDLFLPDGSLVQTTHAEWKFHTEAVYQRLRLKLEFSPEMRTRVAAFFALDASQPVHLFELKAEILTEHLSALAEAEEAVAFLRCADAAMIKLENFVLIGYSAWFHAA